jgi:Uma2 family endonuclease
MPSVSEMVVKVLVPDLPPDKLLISEDGVPLESDWHAVEIGLLRELVHQQFAGRRDFFAGGNMFLYFNDKQLRDRDYRGPDFFFVWDVSPKPLRPYWAIWKEGGRYPNLIIELLSPSTAVEDRTTKKDIYEQIFRTPEYFCYDPDERLLQGWRLQSGTATYQQLGASDKGWIWSEQLGLWLGCWEGVYLDREATWLRLFTPEGAPVPTKDEAFAAARQQASEERCRAEIAEAELARLRSQLEPKKN